MTGSASTDTLANVRQLYADGCFVQAYRSALQQGDLRSWRGTAPRLLAGRLARQLGAERLGNAHFYRAYRDHPADPEATCYYAMLQLDRVGPARTWEFLRRHGSMEDQQPETRAHWLVCHTWVHAATRDFEAADAALDAALALTPRHAWLWVAKAQLRQVEDRHEHAMEAADQALSLRPHHPNAVSVRAELLRLRDEPAAAAAELAASPLRNESPLLLAQLASLLEQEGDYAAALEAWEQYENLCPIAETARQRGLAIVRSRLHYLKGDVPRSISLAREVRLPLFSQLADHMQSSLPTGRRVLLNVPFVRQHHNTCAPATLAALCRFWRCPAEHLQIVEAICYDGTPTYSERSWAVQNGFVAREFTLDAQTTIKLIDRGIPFTLTTLEPQGGHLQAVAGYDTCRGTFLVRDPSQPVICELDIEKTLQRYRSSGPRAMAMVPQEKASLLEDIELPQAELWDLLYQVQEALARHDRQSAAQHVASMQQRAASHFLVLNARRCLHGYDGNSSELLAVATETLQLFPEDPHAELLSLSCLDRLGRREELIELLSTICCRAAAHPVFMQRLAAELWRDARDLPRAAALVRRSLRRQPGEGGAYHVYANILWAQGCFELALQNYRFAACVSPTSESSVQSMFVASRHLRQQQATLDFIQRRAERALPRTSDPTCWLFDAMQALDRGHEGMQILEHAMQVRPDDGGLLLFAAQAYANSGDLAAARRLHEKASGICDRQRWLRASVQLAVLSASPQAAIASARQILELDPLALDMHRELARRLAEMEGVPAAVAHLRDATTRFPHHYGLRQLLIEWLHREPPESWEAEVRRLVQLHPRDAWSRRELADNLARQNRFQDALGELAIALQIAPRDTDVHCSTGYVRSLSGDSAGAAQALQQAIRLAPDNRHAIDMLVNLAHDAQGVRHALEFVQQQLEQQVIFGDGLLAYQGNAVGALPPDQVLSHLQAAADARPDLWHSCCALSRQLTLMQQHERARQVSLQATTRFPLVAVVWSEHAAACRGAGDTAAEIEALRKACRLDLVWSFPVHMLAQALQREKHPDEAAEVLRAYLKRSPLEPAIRCELASLLWSAHRREEALEELRASLRLLPFETATWDQLEEYARTLQRPALRLELARQLVDQRPASSEAWKMLALAAQRPEHAEERLAAVRKSVELAPLVSDGYDLLAFVLAGDGRYDQAVQACRPSVWAGWQPPHLLGREIWVDYQRGYREQAIERMLTLLQAQRNYLWGWLQLVEWLQATPADDRYLAASENACRLQPADPTLHGHLGWALESHRRPDEALAEYTRALALQPGYAYAAHQLFCLHLAASRWSEAEQAIASFSRTVHGAQPLWLSMRLSHAQGVRPRELECFRALCAAEDADETLIRPAVDQLAQSLPERQVKRELWIATRKPTVSPAVADAIIYRHIGSSWLIAAWLAWRLRERVPLSQAADIAYLNAMGASRKWWGTVVFLFFSRRRLRSRTPSWGSAGYALLSLNRYAAACRWLADYRQRQEVRPWMLYNRVLCLVELGRDREARETATCAVTLEADQTTPALFAYKALLEAMNGDLAAAQVSLQASRDGELAGRAAWLRSLAQVLIAFSQPDLAPPQHADLVQRLGQAPALLPASHWMASDRRLYRRLCYRVEQKTKLRVQPAVIQPLAGKGVTQQGGRAWLWILIVIAWVLSRFLSTL